LKNLEVLFLAVEGQAGDDEVGFEFGKSAADMFQTKMEAVGVQDADVLPVPPQGSRGLEEGEGGIKGPEVPMFITVFADDRQFLNARRVDKKDLEVHEFVSCLL